MFELKEEGVRSVFSIRIWMKLHPEEKSKLFREGCTNGMAKLRTTKSNRPQKTIPYKPRKSSTLLSKDQGSKIRTRPPQDTAKLNRLGLEMEHLMEDNTDPSGRRRKSATFTETSPNRHPNCMISDVRDVCFFALRYSLRPIVNDT